MLLVRAYENALKDRLLWSGETVTDTSESG